MEGELFLDGHPPDFSLLQQLLFPPCLEPEPGSPARAPASPARGARSSPRPRPDPPPSPAGCPPPLDRGALSFLQESAQQLPQAPRGAPEPSRAPWAQQQTAGPGAQRPLGAASPRARSPMDALSLISLHCSHLAAGAAPHALRPGLLPPEPGCGRRKPRKQAAPRRSAEPRDPAFQGVTLRMHLRLCQGSPDGYQLLIRPRYSSARRWRSSDCPNQSQTSLARELCGASSSEEEQDALSGQSNKCCASCQTKKTPLWRVAEDGTPLCNACGIRYKKYRVRCFRCWNIPRKSGKSYSRCSNCGDRLRMAVAQQRMERRKCDDFLKSQARTFCS
ncbi:GATA-type zinc finger protein 1 [Carettochelys insculpta]|uniref:GATA-type zinc finger protein 1 n=1 Tax=Carettochelys insculpta TaxID=44489 RepID=UPI003EC14047